MRLLVDAHTVLWAVDDASRLSATATAALQDPANQLLIGAGTIWELSIKVSLGKLTLSLPFRHWMDQAVADLRLSILPITVEHVDRQVSLPFHHRDPFDRLLVSQALVETFGIVSSDSQLDAYGTTRVW
jgi:PIN domain nuclease of toxin-antitoxin system